MAAKAEALQRVSGPVAQLCDGSYFDLEHPERTPVSVEVIAHHLAAINRYVGATRTPYSVAQHAVLCSCIVNEEHALQALHHDDAEFVLGDDTSPKKLLIPEIKQHEDRILRAMFEHLGMPWPMHPAVKQADLEMLATERRDLMPDTGERWGCLEGIQPRQFRVIPWTFWTAKATFIRRHYELTREAA